MSTSINNQKKWTTNSSSDVPAFDADSSEALRFEKLLGEMLRAFMGLTVDEIDGQIEHWLRRIVLELGKWDHGAFSRNSIANISCKSVIPGAGRGLRQYREASMASKRFQSLSKEFSQASKWSSRRPVSSHRRR